MQKWWAGWLLAAMTWAGVASAEVEVPVIENAGYSFCVNEASYALWVGRLPTVFGRTRAQLENDPSIPPYLRGMLSDFFSDQAAGRAQTYVHFALHRFQDCLATQKVKLDPSISDSQTFACLTRMDIPFFFFVQRRSGETLAAAKARIEEALAGWHYPPGLVDMMAEPSWSVQQETDLRTFQGFVFNTCLLPREMVVPYYGVPEAPADAGKGPGAPAK